MKKAKKIMSILLSVTLALGVNVSHSHKVSAEVDPWCTNHTYVEDVCTTCSRIQNAQENVTYSCETTENRKIQVIEFTPTEDKRICFLASNEGAHWDAYGYLFVKDDNFEGYMQEFVEKFNSGVEYPRPTGYIEEDDDSGNNNMPSVVSNVVEGTTYCFVVGPYNSGYGEFEVTIGCPHDETTRIGKTIESCMQGGYTGDVVCDICDKTIEEGIIVEPNSEHDYESVILEEANCSNYARIEYNCINCGHSYEEIDVESGYGSCEYIYDGYVEPTCTKTGFTGREICVHCGKEGDPGQVILSYHDQTESDGSNMYFYYGIKECVATCTRDGYTGDTVCTICRDTIEKGTVIKATNHDYQDGVCDVCGLEEEFLTRDGKGYYLIYTVDDLVSFIKNANLGIDGKLMANITFPDNYVTENFYNDATSMILDGNGYTISNFNINNDRYGLFDYAHNSTFKNLKINCDVDNNPEESFGAIVRGAYGCIFDNCVVNGNITVPEEINNIGGLAGNAYGCTFSNCTNNADITTDCGNVGGIVGEDELCEYTNCTNNGDIHGEEDEIGGIIGEANSAIIKNCVNNGRITTKDQQAGGIAGDVNHSSVSGCKNTGDIYCTGTDEYHDELGGIVGSSYSSDIKGCTNSGNIGREGSNVEYVGGIAGSSYERGSITDSSNDGNVYTEKWCSGGIAGYVEGYYSSEDIIIDNCVNNGDIHANEATGGIVGAGGYMKVTNCTNNGNVSGWNYIGGICGDTWDTEFDKVYNAGAVTGTGEYVSMLVNSSENVKITNSDGNHKHAFTKAVVIKAATISADGKLGNYCSCGRCNETVINRIASVTLSKTSYTFVAAALELPTVVVKDSKGAVIGVANYTVTFTNKATGAQVTAIKGSGTYEATITFKGNYSGTTKAAFTVAKASKPAKVKIKALTNIKTKKAKLTWKKVKGAKGYQIKYSTSKKFKNAKTKTIKKNTSKYTIKKLKKNKKYYVKIRAYKIVNGERSYGKWSKKKSVKIKK